MRWFCGRNKGAISVFLTLILVPVLIFCGIIVDAARLYASKTVVSGAGELTMNAALSQYDKLLKDRYGLTAMAKNPQNMNGQFEQYFRESCNAYYLKNENNENLHSMIQLEPVENSLVIKGMEGTSLAEMQVMKQQMIEYMKFRGPVYMVDEILEKFQKMPLKNMDKKQEYVKKKTEYGKAVSKLDKKLKKAKEAVDSHCGGAAYVVNGENGSPADWVQEYMEQSVFWLAVRSLEKYSSGEISAPVSDAGRIPSYRVSDELSQPYIWSASETDFYTNTAKYDTMIALLTLWNNLELIDAEGLTDEEIDEFNKLPSAMSGSMKTMTNIYRDIHVKNYKRHIDELAKSLDGIIKTGKDAKKALNETLEEYNNKVRKAELNYENVKNELETLGEECPDDGETFKIDEEEIREIQEYISANIDAAGELKNSLDAYRGIPNELESCSVSNYEAEAIFTQGAGRAISDFWNGNGIGSSLAGIGDAHFMNPQSSSFYSEVLSKIDSEKDESAENERKQAKEAAESGQNDYMKVLDDILKEKNLKDYEKFSYPADFPSELMKASSGESGVTAEKIDVSDDEAIIDGSNGKMDWINSLMRGIDSFAGTALQNAYLMEYITEMFNCLTTESEKGVKNDETVLLSLSGEKLTEHYISNGELEYIMYGNADTLTNKSISVSRLFALRFAVDCVYVFFDAELNREADIVATGSCGGQAWLYPIIKYGYLLCRAMILAGEEMSGLVNGKEVAVWRPKEEIKLSYKEYLKLFLLVDMLNESKQRDFIARTADCIQLNTEKLLKEKYTMVSMDVQVKSTVTFLPRAEIFLGNTAGRNEGKKIITYRSILAY